MKVHRAEFTYTTKSATDTLSPVEACLDMLNEAIPAEYIISIREHERTNLFQIDCTNTQCGYYPETICLVVYYRGD